MSNRPASLPDQGGTPLLHRHYGRITAYDELQIDPLGDDYTIEGSGTVSRLPALPGGTTVFAKTTGAPTFVHSARLICQNSVNYTANVGDLLIFRSDGEGAWRLYVIPATRPIISPAQGRLTLISGVAVPNSSVANATQLYYTPRNGGQTPVVIAGKIVMITFSEVSQLTTDATKSPAAVVPNSNHDAFTWWDNGTFRLSRSDYWKKSATVTMTIASPCVVTWTGSDFADGTPIVLTTTGALATGITAGTTYFVKRTGAIGTPTATFNLAATVGGAAINTSGSQSGAHTATAGDDSGSVARASSGNCELVNVNGLLFNKNAISNGPGAQQGLFVGTIRSDASSTLNFVFGTAAAGGGASVFHVWNYFERQPFATNVVDTTTNYQYLSSNIRQAGGSAGNQISFVVGVSENAALASSAMFGLSSALNSILRAGVGLDTTAAFSGTAYDFVVAFKASQSLILKSPPLIFTPSIGAHVLSFNEQGDGSTNNAFNLITGAGLSLEVWM